MMKNRELAHKALETLLSWGVRDICLCPGGRNSPFVFLLSEANAFQIHNGFDERAASFFALGKAQADERPVAIITTSGTAVSEVYSAVIEAHYTKTPLVVISADRPRRMRGTGAPQTIEQVDIFGNYVEKCLDIEGEWPGEISWSLQDPLHLNICFDEPLRDVALNELKPLFPSTAVPAKKKIQAPQLSETFSQFIKDKNNPLLLISGLKPSEVESVREFTKNWRGLIYAESTSGLREMDHPGLIRSGDRFPSYLLKQKKIDGVVRLGGVPTARVWRDLENGDFPVLSISSLPFAGLSRGKFVHAETAQLVSLIENFSSHNWLSSEILKQDEKIHSQWLELLKSHPQSEPALVRWLSEQLKPGTSVYVGNSLPIREWDLTAQRKNNFHVKANRGANGIDGQIASALAHRTPDKDLCVLLGDLTAMYDSNALWYLQNQNYKNQCYLTVLNNRGGKIFQRLFNHSLFYNEHQLNFKGWAETWNCSYTEVTEPQSLPLSTCVLEILPNLEQTDLFWKQFDSLWGL